MCVCLYQQHGYIYIYIYQQHEKLHIGGGDGGEGGGGGSEGAEAAAHEETDLLEKSSMVSTHLFLRLHYCPASSITLCSAFIVI